MRAVAALCAILLSVPCAASPSTGEHTFTLRCEREMQPRIEVVARAAAFAVKDMHSVTALSQLTHDASIHHFVLGMTSGNVRTEILIDGPGLVDPTGARECISPRVFVDISYHPIDVYVAREFNRQSCPYREVHAHEMRHVGLYHGQLPLIQKKVAEALAERYGDRPLYGARGQTLAQMERDVDHWLRPLIKKELAKVEELQRAVDTPEEITRLAGSCGGEVARIIGYSI